MASPFSFLHIFEDAEHSLLVVLDEIFSRDILPFPLFSLPLPSSKLRVIPNTLPLCFILRKATQASAPR